MQLVVGLLCAAVAVADTPETLLQKALPDANAAARAYTHLQVTSARLKRSDPRGPAFLAAQVAARLAELEQLAPRMGGKLALSEADVERRIVDFEAFKYETYVASGVFPKRYFGYFDGQWDSAARERELAEVVHGAVAIIDEDAAARHGPVRVTDAEVAITFLAEGGALLLREKQAEADRVHPVLGIGLDDIVTGFGRRAALMAKLDAALGTHLATVVSPLGLRFLTFREAVAATAVMWLDEKERADALARKDGAPLARRPDDEQFVLASLVYNSGIRFSDERVRMIRDLSAGPYLAQVSVTMAAKRWPLPVLAPLDARAELLEIGRYPEQPTSWNAVYHVLQRYGAYVAMRRFTDVFDARGMFRKP